MDKWMIGQIGRERGEKKRNTLGKRYIIGNFKIKNIKYFVKFNIRNKLKKLYKIIKRQINYSALKKDLPNISEIQKE